MSLQIMIRRRLKRSATTPARGLTKKSGRKRARKSQLIAVPEPVNCG
ncbi:MAG: hypothetical protein R2851_13655 [Caldilineaceae bacterium]